MSGVLALGSPPATSSGSGSSRRQACQHRYHAATAATARRSLRARAGTSTPQQQDAASLDVSGAVVQPSFRSAPWQPNEGEAGTASGPEARVLIVSESGVCRAVLAAAALRQLLDERGLGGRVDVDCRASRNYCVGDGPDPNAALVAAELDWELPRDYTAQQFNEARDIVAYDLVLVVDKFVAADVLREVSVWDTIQTWGKGNYSSKVRRLGEFSQQQQQAPAGAAPSAAGGKPKADPDAADIGDPLYGNVGGESELAAVRSAAAAIWRACQGFADFLATVERQHSQAAEASGGGSSDEASRSESGGGSDTAQPRLGEALTAAARDLAPMEWLVPPMLQAR